MTLTHRLSAASICAILAACSAPPGSPTCDPDQPWQTYEVRPSPETLLFTFEAPAETFGGPEMGLDSFPGAYECGGAALEYHYDSWSLHSPDDAASQPGAIDEVRVIDGVEAHVVTWNQPDDPDGLPHQASVFFERRLTFAVRGADLEALDLAHALFDTIDFP